MSEDIWELLKIEPTADQALIKKAYASQSRIFHPETDPEGFLRLREAYSSALRWAEEGGGWQPLPEGEAPGRGQEGEALGRGQERGASGRGQEGEAPNRGSEEEASSHGLEGEASGHDSEREGVDYGSEREAPDQGPEEEAPAHAPEENHTPNFVFLKEAEGENPYRESEAYKAFLKVYRKENQKNWKLWMEYMTSPEFLENAWEEEFCALIRDAVREREAEFKPGQEFIKSLYTAYCFSATDVVIDSFYTEDGAQAVAERRFRREQSYYAVPEPVLEIAGEYPIPRKVTGNDRAMKVAFSNYCYLRSLDDAGWTEQGLQGLQSVLGKYVLTYIRDNYTGDEPMEAVRHPLGIRLLNYFFETARVPLECCRMAWETLGLKQAVMGRNKVLYGRLREICLEKYPGLDQEEQDNFSELNRVCDAYFQGSYLRDEGDCGKEEQETEAFLGREDIRRALRNRRYVKSNVLVFWLNERRSPIFLDRLRELYEQDMSLPCARQILESIAQAQESRRLIRQNKEDAEASPGECISVKSRPFLRYFLNTAFRDFRELGQYLLEQLPCLPEWAERLPGPGAGQEGEAARSEGGTGEGACRRILLDGTEIEVRLHRRYVEYRADGQEAFRPFLPLERVEALDTEEMLLLLPVAVPGLGGAEQDLYAPGGIGLTGRLQKRLEETALPPQNRGRVSGLICEGLRQRLYDMQSFQGGGLPLRIYREEGDALYCAEWRQAERAMCLYVEQGQEPMKCCSWETYDFIEDEAEAAALGQRLLGQLLAPSPIDCSSMEKLPEAAYVSPPCSPVRVLEGGDIGEEVLNGLLEQFAVGELERLEFSFKPDPWELGAEDVEGYPRKRALVFLKREEGYSCLYFDDAQHIFFALMKSGGGDGIHDYVLLKHRSLPPQCVFHSFDPVRCNLEEILRWASRAEKSPDKRVAARLDGCVWKMAWNGVFIQSRREKYNLAKQELGDFPLERAWNAPGQPVRLDQSPEELNKHPLELELRTKDGAVDTVSVNGIKRAVFSESVKRFFQGSIVWLRLSWDVSPDSYKEHFAPQFFSELLARRMGKPMRSHIILRQEDGRYTMLCLQDLAERAEYYVADKGAYMKVEGKKYPREDFMGKAMPAYLIHRDPVALRNRLDLLLDDPYCLLPVTERFAEFASESPVKARDYDAVREEFVAEHR